MMPSYYRFSAILAMNNAHSMVFKALPDLDDFIRIFKIRFSTVLISVLLIILGSSGKVYDRMEHQYNLTFWICILAMLILFNLATVVFFRADFLLINSTITQFSIDGDSLTIHTAPLKVPLIFNQPSMELTLTMHQFSRDRTIYPIRIFPFVKYPCWELRTEETTVYILTQFFSPEAITELEKFLYWKNVELQNA